MLIWRLSPLSRRTIWRTIRVETAREGISITAGLEAPRNRDLETAGRGPMARSGVSLIGVQLVIMTGQT